MSKNRISITWDDECAAYAEKIASEYERALLLNRVFPTTKNNPEAEERPNISGIIRFALMALAHRADGITVDQDV